MPAGKERPQVPTKAMPMSWQQQRKPARASKVPSSKMVPQVEQTPASGSHLRQGDVKRKGADLLVAPLKLNVRLSKCGPRSVEPLRGS